MLTLCFISKLPVNHVACLPNCFHLTGVISVHTACDHVTGEQVNNHFSGSVICLFHAAGWREGHAGGEGGDSENRQLM